tara:strand:- start:793 stop:894 length:102 start_codon:yes stop_codon:yes gene_type:complete
MKAILFFFDLDGTVYSGLGAIAVAVVNIQLDIS